MMKTLDEIYNEVMTSDELKEKFTALKTDEEVVDFVKSLGGNASLDETIDFLKSKKNHTGQLSDAELEQVVGGKDCETIFVKIAASTTIVFCPLITPKDEEDL